MRSFGRRYGPVLALSALALAIRLSPWSSVFRGGEVFFIDTDDYYHLRRIMTAAANFPSLPAHDTYLGYPGGFQCNWPPLYDLFVGFLTLAAGLGRPSLRLSQTVAALVPPLAGTLTSILFYKAASLVVNRRAALFSLLFSALMPMLVFYTLLGRPDHHCFENLWFMAALIGCLGLIQGGGRPEAWAAGCAAALALGVLFWIGSIVFSITLFLFAAAELALMRERGERVPDRWRWFAAVFLFQIPPLLACSALNSWYASGSIVFDAPSPFQPLLLAALGLWTWGLHDLCALKIKNRALGFFAAAFALTLYLVVRIIPSLAAFASVPLPMFTVFSEMQHFFSPYGRWSLDNARAYFGHALWVIPPLAALIAWEIRTASGRLVLFWSAVTGALMVWQTRYSYHFSLPVSLLLGYGTDRALRWLEEDPPRAGSLPWPRAALGLAIIALLFPALKNVAALPLARAENLTDSADLLAACRWLRENTPPTRSLWKDEGAPEYGVYALHTIGDEIAAVAQRPAAAGSMHLLKDALVNSIAFFFMEGSDQAYEFLRRQGFRYLLLSDLVHDGVLPLYARLFNLRGFDAVPGPDGSLELPPRFWDLVYMRLYVYDGSLARLGPRVVAPADHFRLVYESPGRGHGVSLFKVFEMVEGARLSGSCKTGAIVSASCPVSSNQNRSFVYRNFAPCGGGGRFEMRLPYPGEYTLSLRGLRARLTVTQRDVETGAAKRPAFR